MLKLVFNKPLTHVVLSLLLLIPSMANIREVFTRNSFLVLDQTPSRNVLLPDSLLSRFDLIFIVLDEKREDLDRLVADRVTRNHRFKNENEDGALLDIDETYDEPMTQMTTEDTIFEKYNAIIHKKSQKKILSRRFVQKYIHYAKTAFEP